MNTFGERPGGLEPEKKVENWRKRAEKGLDKIDQILGKDPKLYNFEESRGYQQVGIAILASKTAIDNAKSLFQKIRDDDDGVFKALSRLEPEEKQQLGRFYSQIEASSNAGDKMRLLDRWYQTVVSTQTRQLQKIARTIGEMYQENPNNPDALHMASNFVRLVIPYCEKYFSNNTWWGNEATSRRLFKRMKVTVSYLVSPHDSKKASFTDRLELYESAKKQLEDAGDRPFFLQEMPIDAIATQEDVLRILEKLVKDLAKLQGEEGADEAARWLVSELIQRAASLPNYDEAVVANISQLLIAGGLALMAGDETIDLDTDKADPSDEYEQLLQTTNPLMREYVFFKKNYTAAQKDQLLTYGGVLRHHGNPLDLNRPTDETGWMIPDAEDNKTLGRNMKHIAASKSLYFGDSTSMMSNGPDGLGALGLWVKETDPFVYEYFKVKWRHQKPAKLRNDWIRRDMYQYAMLAYHNFKAEKLHALKKEFGYTIDRQYVKGENYTGEHDIEKDEQAYAAYKKELLTFYAREVMLKKGKITQEELNRFTDTDESNNEAIAEKIQEDLEKRMENVDGMNREIRAIRDETGYSPKKYPGKWEDHEKKYIRAQEQIRKDFGNALQQSAVNENKPTGTGTKESVAQSIEILTDAYTKTTSFNEDLSQITSLEMYDQVIEEFFGALEVIDLYNRARYPYMKQFGEDLRPQFEQVLQRVDVVRKKSKYAEDFAIIETYQKHAASEMTPEVQRYSSYLTRLDTTGLLDNEATYLQCKNILAEQREMMVGEGDRPGPSLFDAIIDAREQQEERQRKVDAGWKVIKPLSSTTPGLYEVATMGASIVNGFVSGTWGVGIELGSLIESPFVSDAWLEGHKVLKERMNGYLTIPMSTEHIAPLLVDGSTNFTVDNVLYNVGHSTGAMIALLSGAGMLGNTFKGAKITIDGIRYALTPSFLNGTALFTAGFVTTVGSYFTQAMEQTQDLEQSRVYALVQSGAAGLLELIAPNKLTGLGPMVFNPELLAKESTKKVIFRYFLKEIVEENVQEVMQDFSEKKFNQVFNYYLEQEGGFETSLTWNDIKAIMLITSLTTGLVQSPNSIRLSMREGDLEKQLGNLGDASLEGQLDANGFPVEDVIVQMQNAHGETEQAVIPVNIWNLAYSLGMKLDDITHEEIIHLINECNEQGIVLNDQQIRALWYFAFQFSSNLDAEEMSGSALEQTVIEVEAMSSKELQEAMDGVIAHLQQAENNEKGSIHLIDENTFRVYLLIIDRYMTISKGKDQRLIELVALDEFLVRLGAIYAGEEMLKADDEISGEALHRIMHHLTAYIPLPSEMVGEILQSRMVLSYLYDMSIYADTKDEQDIFDYDDVEVWKHRLGLWILKYENPNDTRVQGMEVQLTKQEYIYLKSIYESPSDVTAFIKRAISSLQDIQGHKDDDRLNFLIRPDDLGSVYLQYLAYYYFNQGLNLTYDKIQIDYTTGKVTPVDAQAEIDEFALGFEYLDKLAKLSPFMEEAFTSFNGYRQFVETYQNVFRLPTNSEIGESIDKIIEGVHDEYAADEILLDNGSVLDENESEAYRNNLIDQQLLELYVADLLPFLANNHIHREFFFVNIYPTFRYELWGGDYYDLIDGLYACFSSLHDVRGQWSESMENPLALLTTHEIGLIRQLFGESGIDMSDSTNTYIFASLFYFAFYGVEQIVNQTDDRDVMKQQLHEVYDAIITELSDIRNGNKQIDECKYLSKAKIEFLANLGVRGYPQPARLQNLLQQLEAREQITSLLNNEGIYEVMTLTDAHLVLQELIRVYIASENSISLKELIEGKQWSGLVAFLTKNNKDIDFVKGFAKTILRTQCMDADYASDISFKSISPSQIPDFVRAIIRAKLPTVANDVLIEKDPFMYQDAIDLLLVCDRASFWQVAEWLIDQGMFYDFSDGRIPTEFALLIRLGVFDYILSRAGQEQNFPLGTEFFGESLITSHPESLKELILLLYGQDITPTTHAELQTFLVSQLLDYDAPKRQALVEFFYDLDDAARPAWASFLTGTLANDEIIQVHEQETLLEKVRMLIDLGFTYEQRSILLRSGICGKRPETNAESNPEVDLDMINSPLGKKIEQLLIGELVKRLNINIHSADDSEYFEGMLNEIHSVTMFLLQHVVYEKVGERTYVIHGVESLLLAMNATLGRGLQPHEITEIASEIENIVTENIALDETLLGQETAFDAYLAEQGVTGLSDIMHAYPILHEHQEVFTFLIEEHGMKAYELIGKGQQGYILDIGDGLVLKLIVGATALESNTELASHQKFYDGLQDIKATYPAESSHIAIPSVQDQYGLQHPGAFIMQKVEGTSIQQGVLKREFASDLTNIGSYLMANEEGSKVLKMVADKIRITVAGVAMINQFTDETVLSLLSVEDIKTFLYEKYRLGDGRRNFGEGNVYLEIFNITHLPKKMVLKDLIAGLQAEGKLGQMTEQQANELHTSLVEQLEFVEMELRKKGLIHTDLHASNVLYELDVQPDGSVQIKLYIIDFGIVSIDMGLFLHRHNNKKKRIDQDYINTYHVAELTEIKNQRMTFAHKGVNPQTVTIGDAVQLQGLLNIDMIADMSLSSVDFFHKYNPGPWVQNGVISELHYSAFNHNTIRKGDIVVMLGTRGEIEVAQYLGERKYMIKPAGMQPHIVKLATLNKLGFSKAVIKHPEKSFSPEFQSFMKQLLSSNVLQLHLKGGTPTYEYRASQNLYETFVQEIEHVYNDFGAEQATEIITSLNQRQKVMDLDGGLQLHQNRNSRSFYRDANYSFSIVDPTADPTNNEVAIISFLPKDNKTIEVVQIGGNVNFSGTDFLAQRTTLMDHMKTYFKDLGFEHIHVLRGERNINYIYPKQRTLRDDFSLDDHQETMRLRYNVTPTRERGFTRPSRDNPLRDWYTTFDL